MYCPRCGQQVPDDGLRFCSRCGLRLDGVALLLANDGVIQEPGTGQDQSGVSSKRKGMRRGAKLMFLSGVLAPIFFGLCFMDESPAPLIVPLTIFMAGLAWILYFYLFGDDTSTSRQPARLGGHNVAPLKAMPAQQSGLNIKPGPQPIRTGEPSPRPSVTEGTTELFDGR